MIYVRVLYASEVLYIMAKQKQKKEGAYAELTGFRRSIPLILLAIAVFISLCFIMQDTGALGRAISKLLLGLFSIGGYFIPAFLAIHAFFYASDFKKKRIITRIIFTCITVFTISALTHAISSIGEELYFDAGLFYSSGIELQGGGFVGGLISFLLTKLFGTVGLIIIAVLIFSIYLAYFFVGGKAVFSRLLLKILNAISDFFALLDKKRKKNKENKAEKREMQKRSAIVEAQEDLVDDDFFEVDNGLQELVIADLGIKESRDAKESERNPHLQERVFHKSTVTDDTPNREKQRTYDDFGLGNNAAHSFNDATENPFTKKKSYVPNENDIVYDAEETSSFEDASAEDLFGSGFEPFDLKINEKLSTKPSSKGTVTAAKPEGISEIKRPINDLDEDDIERARQRADFEMKKRAAIEAQRRYVAARDEIERKSEEIHTPTYEEPVISTYETPKSPAYEDPTVYLYEKQNSPSYEEENATDKYETPAPSEPYIPEYMSTSEPEEEPLSEEVKNESFELNRQKENFAFAMDDYEKAQNESIFKPFSPLSEEIHDTLPEKEDEEELVVTRTMLEPTPSLDYTSDEPQLSDSYDDVEDDGDEDTPNSCLTFDFSEDGNDEYDSPIPVEEQNPNVIAQRKMFPFLDDTPTSKSEDENNTSFTTEEFISFEELAEDREETEAEQEETANEKPPFDFAAPKAPFPTEKPKPAPAPEAKEETPDYSDYQFPPLDLLIKGKAEEDLNQEEEKNQNAEKLVDALLQFNVRISIKGIDRGPRITRYEIVPARGVKVNSVTNLFNDIALNLGVEGMRMEAPIPGKSAIGVEIPNKKPSTVLLRDLVESDEFICASSKTMSCLGKDVTGNPVFADIAKMPHVLIAGATGMGKSVCINSILISILYKARPDEVKLIMIDPKKVEFNGYNGIPHLLVPVVTDVKQAAGALMWAVEQMEKRYDLMEALEVRKIDAYNEKVRENPELGKPLPKIIIIIDELNDIMLQVRKPAEDLIMSIAQKARAAGIHLIIGTQRPSVDVITGVIKANIPSRISCKVASYNDSKTILEQAGAEKLLNNGDMLYVSAGAPKALRVQGAFVSDGEVAAIMKFLKSQAKGNIYDSQALEEINKAAQKCSKGKGSDDYDSDDDDGGDSVGVLNDQQFLDAVDLAIKSEKISTSLIQRKISIGYGKAAKFIDIMEDMGIVSEPNGQKPRDVLITKDEWHEMLSRRSLD